MAMPEPATLDTALRAALLERYTIERELGRGGMATVYLGRDLRHKRNVAVKVLDPHIAAAGVERFLREIHIAARLTHPHVLGVHDSGESAGHLYYVMPYVDGETLRTRLGREGALPLADAVRLLRELADALAYAHEHGVIHRDLKPENVLLSGGHAVVADFGIAKAIAAATEDRSASGAGLTATGVAVGTPAYMAPEQAVGDVATDHRADLYALGVIAYEMLAGSHPFVGRTPQALAAAHLTEPPAPLAARRSNLPPALAALVMQLLAKDPAARPATAEDVRQSLDEIGMPPSGTTSARRGVIVLGAAAVLITAGLMAYRWSREARVATTAAPAVRTLAVLPFVNTSGSPNDDYFSDGLTDELAHALARLPGVRVAGRTSSYTFKGKSVAAQEIGRALDVSALVGGTVRRAGDRLRVTTQLVSTIDGKVMWDSVYEHGSSDVFTMQDELTRAIVDALLPTLAGNTRGSTRVVADVRRGTANEEAYELYLKGRYYWLQRGAANLTRSIGYFREAIARDPAFARAHAGLSMAYGVIPNWVPDPADTTPALSMASARRAVALDSTLAEAQQALGGALDLQLRFAEGLRRYRAAVTLDPSNSTAHHWLGASLLNLGRTEEGIAELQRAAQADPLALSGASAFGTALLYGRRFPEAITASQRVLAIDSTFIYAIWTLGIAQVFAGHADSAVTTLERAVHLYPNDARQLGGLLFAYAAAGRWADADRVREQLRRPGVDMFDGIQPAFADLIFGDPRPLARLLASDAGLRRFQKYGGIVGCSPLFDLLWSDAEFRASMRTRGVEPCALAGAWPIRPRVTGQARDDGQSNTTGNAAASSAPAASVGK